MDDVESGWSWLSGLAFKAALLVIGIACIEFVTSSLPPAPWWAHVEIILLALILLKK